MTYFEPREADSFGFEEILYEKKDWLAVHYTSWEPLEGMSAFVEKRPANYIGLREKAAARESSGSPGDRTTRVARPAAPSICPSGLRSAVIVAQKWTAWQSPRSRLTRTGWAS